MTGQELYERWLMFAGMPLLSGMPGSDMAAWKTLDLHRAEAWNDLAKWLEEKK